MAVSMAVVEEACIGVEVGAAFVVVAVEVGMLGIAGRVVSWLVSLPVSSRSFTTPFVAMLIN
ncbi:hypothetical protein JCM16161A_02770 [Vulcanisaeta sp. JCM 16161]